MNKLKTTILSLCLILMCISIVSSASAVDDVPFYNMTNPFYDNGIFCNVTNLNGPCNIIKPHFEMTAIVNSGTGCHWEVDRDASYGVKIIKDYTTDGYGSLISKWEPSARVTQHFVFEILDNNANGHFVKLNLVSPAGEVVDTLTSDMLN